MDLWVIFGFVVNLQPLWLGRTAGSIDTPARGYYGHTHSHIFQTVSHFTLREFLNTSQGGFALAQVEAGVWGHSHTGTRTETQTRVQPSSSASTFWVGTTKHANGGTAYRGAAATEAVQAGHLVVYRRNRPVRLEKSMTLDLGRLGLSMLFAYTPSFASVVSHVTSRHFRTLRA